MYQSTNSPIRSGGGLASRRCCAILLVDRETGKLVDWELGQREARGKKQEASERPGWGCPG
jgi:hypothetical protein